MLREGRELIPTAKAFPADDACCAVWMCRLSKAALTGEWEYKLAQMEQGSSAGKPLWPKLPP